MQTLYSLLFNLTSFVVALLFVCAFFSLPNATQKQRLIYGGISLIVCVVAGGAHLLKQRGHLPLANLLMGILWGTIVAVILWAVFNARWN